MPSPKADAYFNGLTQWKTELQALRKLVLSFDLKEDIKWQRPCYSVDGKNVLSISGFKAHYGIWFFQGVFLSDPHNLLSNAQEGKTKAMRHIKFDNQNKPDNEKLRTYIQEAIINAKNGKVIKAARKSVSMPRILKECISMDEEFADAFRGFSTAKQNEFKAYIHEAKREATKVRRLDKIRTLILKGEGLNDRYKS